MAPAFCWDEGICRLGHQVDLPAVGGFHDVLTGLLAESLPEFTSRACKAIIQPRRAAYSRIARFCIAKVW